MTVAKPLSEGVSCLQDWQWYGAGFTKSPYWKPHGVSHWFHFCVPLLDVLPTEFSDPNGWHLRFRWSGDTPSELLRKFRNYEIWSRRPNICGRTLYSRDQYLCVCVRVCARECARLIHKGLPITSVYLWTLFNDVALQYYHCYFPYKNPEFLNSRQALYLH